MACRRPLPVVRAPSVVSPIRSIPNFIPIMGEMENVLVVTLGLKYLQRFVPRAFLMSVRETVTRRPVHQKYF